MEFTIKEYTNYNESEVLNLYKSVGWTNYTNNPKMLEDAYVNSLSTEKTIQFYRSLGFTMDTDMECRAFSIYF